jgi:hypothetical protein
MKRGLIALLAAVFLAGIETAHAQTVVYDSTAGYVTANKNFSTTPTSWKDNLDSQPASGYTGPSFSYAGVDEISSALAIAKVSSNGRMQMQSATNFHDMVSFDIAATKVTQIDIQGSTFGTGVAGDDTYLILHDSTQTYENGWYAALLHSRSEVSTFTYSVAVADATWYQFTPSIVDGTVPLGTIGSAVDISVITDGTFDEVGFYADVYNNGGGNANNYLWYLAIYEPSADAVLEVGTFDPMYVEDASGVATGTVSVSYTEGIPPTNVTVTSVSVVDQTHSGAFANITALPLTLTSPSPASETISVEFDNTVAGLVAGETATGVVEVIWNEVGSASSATSTVPVSATYLAINPGNTIAIFDSTADNASPRLGGLTARISYGYSTSSSLGSTDGSYGSLPGNAPTAGGCYRASLTYPVVAVAITNETGYDCTFDSLHFDAAKQYNKGLKKVAVSMSGDVTGGPLFTNSVDLTQFAGAAGDYDDFDIDLTALADRTLAHGEAALIEFTFFDGDSSNSNAVSCLDNIALLGSGSNGASMTKVPGGLISMPISGLSLGASELIEMFYEEGDAATNVVITGVSFADETDPGAFSWSGSLPLELAAPEVTNTIGTVLFDNTVANVPAGTNSYALMQIEWNEIGLPSRTFDVSVYTTRPANVPTNTVIALFDTTFLAPDAAVNGVLGSVSGGNGVAEQGSNDGTYGTLANPAAPVTVYSYRAYNSSPIVTISVSNQTVANIELSAIHFDVGRNWLNSPEAFTLSIDGDVTADAALLVATNLTALLSNLGGDADDFDVDLTGLADHTLAANEAVVFTITFDAKVDQPFYSSFVDNIALIGTFDGFGGWAVDAGLTEGVNDAPSANPDGDGKDNFMEFATGGDPLVADGAAATMWQTAEGGTNWLYHVHAERQDVNNLTYGVGTKGNLQYDPSWDSGDVEQVGATTGPGLWKTVTNRTDMGAAAKFIGLTVEQN